MAGIIAIVGRPNVGKSALFNRIVGRRIAIVHDEPGVTRDRVAVETEWRGRGFTMIDTGGIGLPPGEKAPDVITKAAVDQVLLAIEAADVILFVVNVQEGVMPLDEEVSRILHRTAKPVMLVVNKVDNAAVEAGTGEFAELGYSEGFAVSAIHGRGVDRLIGAAVKALPPETASPKPPVSENEDEGVDEIFGRPVRLAIVGRPNVGKSSIINALTQSDRVIVSSIPGTTRDAVDVPFEVETDGVRQSFVLVDTAGVRKKRRVKDTIEFFSVKRTEDAIDRCDIAVLVMDAEAGITEQDKKIADRIEEGGKASILVINKWDLVADAVLEARKEEISKRKKGERTEKGTNAPMTTLAEFGSWVQERLFFMDYAPVIFTSAQSGFHLDRLLEAIRYVTAQLRQQIPTSLVNRTLRDAFEHRKQLSKQGQVLKFYYATQVKQAPPTFLIFMNRPEVMEENYRKYLVGKMRQAFGFEGCPVHLVARERPKKVESIRKPKKKSASTPKKNRAKSDARPVKAPRKGTAKR